jgi:hypothetical protein
LAGRLEFGLPLFRCVLANGFPFKCFELSIPPGLLVLDVAFERLA